MGENETTAVRYELDASKSRFTVRAFAAGLLSALGHSPTIAIRDFTGEAQFTPGTLETASLQIAIKADSLAVVGDASEKDRREIERTMREEVLETGRYPDIVFKSTEIAVSKTGEGRYRVKIRGDLSLHGVTRSETIDAYVTMIGGSLRAHGEFPLRQTDYGIKLASALGGTIKVRDELKFSFDLAARQEHA